MLLVKVVYTLDGNTIDVLDDKRDLISVTAPGMSDNIINTAITKTYAQSKSRMYSMATPSKPWMASVTVLILRLLVSHLVLFSKKLLTVMLVRSHR